MNTPEKVFKLQTQLSESSGTKKIFEWLIGLALLLLIAVTVEALFAKDSLLRAISSPLLMLALFTHMRTEAKRKTEDLERQLGP